jgi:hypothetical protein
VYLRFTLEIFCEIKSGTDISLSGSTRDNTANFEWRVGMDFRFVVSAFFLGVLSATAVTGLSFESERETISPAELEKKMQDEEPALPEEIRKDLEDTERWNRRFTMHYKPSYEGKGNRPVAVTGNIYAAHPHGSKACSSSTNCAAFVHATSLPPFASCSADIATVNSSSAQRSSENGSFQTMLSMLVDNDRKIPAGKKKKKQPKDDPTERNPYALAASCASPPNTIMMRNCEPADIHPSTA